MDPTKTKNAVKDVEPQTETQNKDRGGKESCNKYVVGELKKMLSKYCAPLQKKALLDLVVSMTKFERDGLVELLEEEMTDWLNNKWCDFPIEEKWEVFQMMKADPRLNFEDAKVIEDRDTEKTLCNPEKLLGFIPAIADDAAVACLVCLDLQKVNSQLAGEIRAKLWERVKPIIEDGQIPPGMDAEITADMMRWLGIRATVLAMAN